jgi:hypothetical protein
MAVAPQSALPLPLAQQFASLLASKGTAGVPVTPTTPAPSTPARDVTPPSAPVVHVDAVTSFTVTVSWGQSVDNVGVPAYVLYMNGFPLQGAVSPITLVDLVCGLSYTIGVEAVDAAGNHSTRTNVSAVPKPCGSGGGGGGTTDTTRPTTPAGLAATAPGQTSLLLSWSASSDNVGVTGYRLYQGGNQVGTAAGTSYTFTGLTCGTSYTLGVAAVDAAQNVSTTSTVGGQTSACSGGGGATDVFVAQVGSGLVDGSSCANARPVSFFNGAANWGSG